MIKLMLAVRRKPGMTRADYLDYLQSHHGQLARDRPNEVLRYVQNHVFDGAYGAPGDAAHGPLFARDSVTELWFADPAALARNLAHPYTQEVIVPDGRNFADVATNVALVTREEELLARSTMSNTTKVLHFMQKRAAVSPEDFGTRWSAATRALLAADTPLGRAASRCVLSHRLPLPPVVAADGGPKAFSGAALPLFHGVASLWFDADDGLAALSGYLADMTGIGGSDDGFFEPSAGFYVCATEKTIFDFVHAISTIRFEDVAPMPDASPHSGGEGKR